MSIAPGARLGAYEVLALLGVGGMGEVYRARDTKLNRDVALKVLPDSFADDTERVARFRREAQILASLNHPNIAAIYGLEDVGGVRALVLELVEGVTLSELLDSALDAAPRSGAARQAVGVGPHGESRKVGPLPLEEALPIARQIAEALEAAHEHGIVHRDLKPANIKVRPDGMVKVLDFGLAKALDPLTRPSGSLSPGGGEGWGVGASQSPTVTSPAATRVSVIMGTAAYMSPEQAKGKTLDKRTDIWAFGCVFYEMLTGKQAFDGEDVTDVIASIVKGEPLWNLLPKTTPANIRFLLERCLEKDPKRRLHDMADFRILLDAPAAPAVPALTPHRRGRAVFQIVAAATVAAALTGLAVWALQPEPARRVRRFAITLPAGDQFSLTNRHLVALSPDGSRMVYGANQRLYLRQMDQLEAEPIRGTEGDSGNPFFSPDGQWIGFWQGGQLKKVAVTGGAPVTLCQAQNPMGASWGTDDVIVFGQGPEGIWQVSSSGGKSSVLIKLDAAKGETTAHGPQMLPGGEAVLFTLRRGTATNWNDAQIVVQTLKTSERRVVIEGGTDARYLPTGHLVYARGGVLLAMPFDLRSMAPTGGPIPVVESVSLPAALGGVSAGGGVSGAAHFSLSQDGTLAYVPGSQGTTARTLVWVDRQGREEPVAGAPARAYVYPRISPDGARVALDIRDQQQDIWVWDFARTTLTRVTADAAADIAPVWTPDGKRIVFSSGRAGEQNLFWQTADGTGAADRLSKSRNVHLPTAVSPDGTRLLFNEQESSSEYNLGILNLTADHRAELATQTPFNEHNGDISPDARFVAYQSNESGQYEIYLRPFPDVKGSRQLVSTAGGTRPLWARSGRELFYLTASGAVMAVPVQTTPTLTIGTPVKLFEGPYFRSFASRTYDVSPDGQRFLMIKEGGSTTQAAPQIIVVENWLDELKRLVPTGN